MEHLTDYEKQRAARLAQNQAMLENLGLSQAAKAFEEAIVDQERFAEQRAQDVEVNIKTAVLEAGVRRSSRRKSAHQSAHQSAHESAHKGSEEDVDLEKNSEDEMFESCKRRKKEDMSEESEEDYRPDFEELSFEEESGPDSDRDSVGQVASGQVSAKGSGKKSRKRQPAQSGQKASRKKQQKERPQEEQEEDEDEFNLQKALALSLDVHGANLAVTQSELANPASAEAQAVPETPTPAKPKRVPAASKSKAPTQSARLYADTSDIRQKLDSLRAQQTGALQPSWQNVRRQESHLMSAPPSEAAAEPVELLRGTETEGGASTSSQAEALKGATDGAFGKELGAEPEASVAEAVQKDSKAGKGRKQKAKKAAAQPPTHEEVDALFHIFDDQSSGQLSLADIRHVAQAHDFAWSDEQIADMIGMFDADQDGLLGLDDFRLLVERCKVVLT